MSSYNVISADSHIVEPPDLYESRIEPKFRTHAPRIERHRTRTGQEYDAWYLDGVRVGTVGSVIQAGRRFEDPGSIDFLGVWEDVRKAAYDPAAMLEELEVDGVWGACLQPSQGLFWYRLSDSELLSALCRAYNVWITDFCRAAPGRLKGIGMLNRSRPREQRLLDALLIDGHDLRRCLRPLPAFESWLGRARNGLGAPLAAADGFHLPRAACARPGLEVAARDAAQRILAAQHVRGIHGGRLRHSLARCDRGRQHAVGQRLPACRVNVAEVARIPGSDLHRRPRGGPA